jgi:hypothetical protein
MFDSQSIGKIPELLAEHRHAEMDLLRTVISRYVGRESPQHVHQMTEPAPPAEQSVYVDLLRGLQSYCSDDTEGGTEEKWWTSNASSAWLSNAFYARVMDIVEIRSLWHAEKRGLKQSCGSPPPAHHHQPTTSPPAAHHKPTTTSPPAHQQPTTTTTEKRGLKQSCGAGRSIHSRRNTQRKLSSTAAMTMVDAQALLATNAKTVSGTQGTCCDRDDEPPKLQKPPKSDTIATFAPPCLQSQSCNGPGQKPKVPVATQVRMDTRSTGLDKAPPQECQNMTKDSDSQYNNLSQNTGEDEEWPEGNGSCEGCGRITYGCEAWSTAGVILCSRCRKARSPMWWALASEAFKMQSTIHPAAVLGGA